MCIHGYRINTAFTEREFSLSVVWTVIQMTLHTNAIEPDLPICENYSIKMFLIHSME